MDARPNTQANGGGEDALLSFLLLLGIAGGGLWFLWYKFHPQISAYVITVQHWEMGVISHFTDRYAVLDRQALSLDPSVLPFKTLYKLCHMVGLFFRIPAAILIAILALLCLVRNPASRFTKVHTTETLAAAQTQTFPTIAAFAGRDLRPSGIAEGEPRPLDPALHPGEWILRHARNAAGTFDDAAAYRELVRQLGPVWSGPSKAPPVVRCLFAAFVLHAARDREGAQAFLGEWSTAMSSESREGPAGPAAALPVPPEIVARADTILTDPNLAQYLTCADRHAFTTPAVMTVLMEARRRAGVLAPAQFNVMKLTDRRLWYALHSLGFPEEAGAEPAAMPNPRVEAAGARDHWATEQLEGQALPVPSVDRALAALRQMATKTETRT